MSATQERRRVLNLLEWVAAELDRADEEAAQNFAAPKPGLHVASPGAHDKPVSQWWDDLPEASTGEPTMPLQEARHGTSSTTYPMSYTIPPLLPPMPPLQESVVNMPVAPSAPPLYGYPTWEDQAQGTGHVLDSSASDAGHPVMPTVVDGPDACAGGVADPASIRDAGGSGRVQKLDDAFRNLRLTDGQVRTDTWSASVAGAGSGGQYCLPPPRLQDSLFKYCS